MFNVSCSQIICRLNGVTSDISALDDLHEYITTFGIWIYHYKLNALNTYLIKATKLAVSVHMWNIINYQQNIFEGGLHIPNFQLIIQSDVSSDHWYCDHDAFAVSEFDGTPSIIIHGVLSRCTSDLSFAYFQKHKLYQKVLIARKDWIELENVPSPENGNKYRSVIVEVIRIEQALTVTMCRYETSIRVWCYLC